MTNKIALPVLTLMLLSAALSLGVIGLPDFRIVYALPYTDIDVDAAYSMITNGSYPDLVVLDVRTKSEYDGGHIYGAVWIPHTELETRISELSGHENDEIIVYCGSGVRSVLASEILDAQNFTKVYNMLGGITAWQFSGYPVWIATVHNLNTAFNYDTIQAAVYASQTLEGHTILVDKGTYYEHVTITKSISLIGENRSTTVIDGSEIGNVIDITADQVNITNLTIRNGTSGIFINNSSYVLIDGNIVAYNQRGIYFVTCPSCIPARECTIRNNTIKNNQFGISLGAYIGNIVYHNNFIGNALLQVEYPGVDTIWNNGYPSGGNYWSDHNPPDVYSGPNQNETGRDKIGDISYIIGENNLDKYPLIYPYGYVPTIDVNNDGLIDIVDIVIVAIAFGSRPGDPNWDPYADINQDGIVDIVDIVMIAIHFGEAYP
jgi:parallel beta-helix repeat protein